MGKKSLKLLTIKIIIKVKINLLKKVKKKEIKEILKGKKSIEKLLKRNIYHLNVPIKM